MFCRGWPDSYLMKMVSLGLGLGLCIPLIVRIMKRCGCCMDECRSYILQILKIYMS